ncbi:MAG: hypothetical protein ACSLFF_11130 [Solirubrobacterales bacterium]
MGCKPRPGRNSFVANKSYHSTARAIGNLQPFKTAAQKAELLDRFGNHLSHEPVLNPWGKPYLKLNDEVKTLAFNPMNNHLHNISHQLSNDGITKLMSRVMAKQAASFNKQSGWRGSVFSPFHAKPFEESLDPTQIKDMIAYVELNDPIQQFETPFASYQVIAGNLKCDWYDPEFVLGVFGGMDGYCEYMNRRGPAIVRRKLIESGISPRRYPFKGI